MDLPGQHWIESRLAIESCGGMRVSFADKYHLRIPAILA